MTPAEAMRALLCEKERILRDAYLDGYRGHIGFADWPIGRPARDADAVTVTIGFDTIRMDKPSRPDHRTWTFFDLSTVPEGVVIERLPAKEIAVEPPCVRCFLRARAQPVMMTRAEVLDWHIREFLNIGCLHPVTVEVSFDEFSAIAREEREEAAFVGVSSRAADDRIVLPAVSGDLVTVKCRKPPWPMPFVVKETSSTSDGLVTREINWPAKETP